MNPGLKHLKPYINKGSYLPSNAQLNVLKEAKNGKCCSSL